MSGTSFSILHSVHCGAFSTLYCYHCKRLGGSNLVLGVYPVSVWQCCVCSQALLIPRFKCLLSSLKTDLNLHPNFPLSCHLNCFFQDPVHELFLLFPNKRCAAGMGSPLLGPICLELEERNKFILPQFPSALSHHCFELCS